MTNDLLIVLGILALAIILFITEKIRMDIVALIVLVSLTLAGLITPSEALSGFSNPAVVTVWATLILSSALSKTGVAALIGRPVLRLGGNSEARLIAVIMILVGVLSGFMNNIGVAALMLPVVVDIARKTGRPPSRLLMPLAFASLMGGLSTLIGTPPNILISEALRQYGSEPFQMFDYTPTGIFVMFAGTAFMVLIGRHLLPSRDIKDLPENQDVAPGDIFNLTDGLFVLRLPNNSTLNGKSLSQSRIGAALSLNVLAILREGNNHLAPTPDEILIGGDRLLVEGSLNLLSDLQKRQIFIFESDQIEFEQLLSPDIHLAELAFSAASKLSGKTLDEIDFRNKFGAVVLVIRRGDRILRTNLEQHPLQPEDILLVQGSDEQLTNLNKETGLFVNPPQDLNVYQLEDRLMALRLPADSPLVGKTLIDSHLGDAFGFGVMGIVRNETTHLIPSPNTVLETDDLLLVKGRREDISIIEGGLQRLEIDDQPPPALRDLESEEVGLMDVVLSPRTTLINKTPRQIFFRDKFGLSILAIWREGRAYRSNLRDMALRFGDALLLYGPQERLQMLGKEPDFLVLTESAQEAPRLNKAPIALLIMIAVLIPVILNWLPISITVIAGVIFMVLTGCLTMEEAYQAIEWKAVFLIAGMLPLGIAMEQTGAAQFLAEGMVSIVGGYGPLAVMAGLFLLAAIASQVMPNPAIAVLLAPIAFNTAIDLGISPYPFMMAVAISASAAFLSPVGHSSNILVMGPGGYKFSDFTKVGVPLTLVVLFVVLLVVPIFWPF